MSRQKQKRKLSPAAEQERTLHHAEMVVDGAKRRAAALLKVSDALYEVRHGLKNPTGEWNDRERAARNRLLQALEEARDLLEEPK